MLCKNIKNLGNTRIISDIILMAVPCLYIFSSLSLLINIPLSSYHLLIYWLIFSIFILWLNQSKNVFSVGILLIIAAIAGWLATELTTYFIDVFWDSRTYHGPATLYLADGWNPFYSWKCCEYSTLPLLKVDERVLLESYPKAQWIVTATVHAALGYLEKTHVINLWLLAAVFVSSMHFLRAILCLSTSLTLLSALAITANPVILSQAFSGYIDGALAATLTIFVLSGITYIHSKNKIHLLYSLIYLPVLINIKMTGLVYGTFFSLFLLLYAWWVNKTPPKNLVLSGAGVWLSAVLLFGFNPYVTNTIQYHNPFHVAYSFGSNANVISDMAVPEFIAKSRFEKFLIATFSTGHEVNWKKPEWKVPFSSLKFEPSADTRFSGFGPLFSGLLIIAGCLALFLRHRRAWVIIATISASIFITDAAWWPRLAPQFWLVPILIVIFMLEGSNYSESQGKIKYLSISFLIVLIFNSTLVAANTWSEQRQAELEYRPLYYKNIAGIVTGAARGSDAFQLYSLHRIQHMGFEGPEVADCINDSMIKRKSWIIRGVALCVPVKIRRLQEILDELRAEKQTFMALLSVIDFNAIQISNDTLAMFKQIGLDINNQDKTFISASNHSIRARNIQAASLKKGATVVYDQPACPMKIRVNYGSPDKKSIYKTSINGVDLSSPFDWDKLVMSLIVIYDNEIAVYLFPKSNDNDHNAVSFNLQYQIKAVCS